jgi:tRNA A37 threonylcarbamoyladenosine modification protein TsaB
MKLYLSAPDMEKIIIRLEENKKIIAQIEEKHENEQAENFLLLIDKILTKNKLKLDDIKEIQVENTGKSFSALRLVISIANTLAYAKKIPIKGLKGKNLKFSSGELVKPIYNREPNITVPNK